MFPNLVSSSSTENTPKKESSITAKPPFIAGNYLQNSGLSQTNHVMNYSSIDSLLEKEKNNNKMESWNKLDKIVKTQKLHSFAEKYGREQSLPVKEIKALKLFFIDCLEKGKLQKTKDVVYDKDDHEILSIPSLHFNMEKKCFTLRALNKRVSTLKSLTPKRSNLPDLNTITDV